MLNDESDIGILDTLIKLCDEVMDSNKCEDVILIIPKYFSNEYKELLDGIPYFVNEDISCDKIYVIPKFSNIEFVEI